MLENGNIYLQGLGAKKQLDLMNNKVKAKLRPDKFFSCIMAYQRLAQVSNRISTMQTEYQMYFIYIYIYYCRDNFN